MTNPEKTKTNPMAASPSPRLRLAGFAAAAVFVVAFAVSAIQDAGPVRGPWTLDPASPAVTLEDVEREVIRRYPVADVSVSSLAAMMAAGPVTLFDVRTRDEFEAGHLPGAIRIEPGSSAEEILNQHRDRLFEKAIVFYCAVGVRSSQVLMQTLHELAPHAKGRLYNLRGGTFRWAAEGRALVRGSEPGELHPYDENWGRLLARTIPGS